MNPSIIPGGFDVALATRLVFGVGCVEQVGPIARELGRRALLVTDGGLVRAGHAGRVAALLAAAGLEVAVCDEVQPNPTTRDVAACLAAARAHGADLLVALGGGSAIDAAKGANFLLTNGGVMKDYQGVGKARLPLLPLLAIPTTAGTGSECQSFALIADDATHRKMACGDPKAAPRVALLDPALTVSQPRATTAAAGIDTVGHAVEAMVTRVASPWSRLLAREAFRLASRSLPAVMERPGDLEARGEAQLAAAWAGLAIEASMLGAAHAAANPLTAHHGVEHGRAVGAMLPAVIRWNRGEPGAAAGYAELAVAAGLVTDADATRGAIVGAVDQLLARVEHLLAVTETPRSLAAHGVTPAAIPALAGEAAEQWTGRFNPRAVDRAAFEALYLASL